MAILSEYHKPTTIAEALALLGRADVSLLPLAGGTRLVGQMETRQQRHVDGVVDLADLGLDFIEVTEDSALRIGATTVLADLVAHPQVEALAQGILGRTARYEGPVNLRNAATVGGVVAVAETDSELYAALLTLDATVLLSDGARQQEIRLSEFSVLPPGHLITAVQVPMVDPKADLHSGHARVARTPSDRCIVAAVALAGEDVQRVALCGVADRPILYSSDTPNPPADFKGSADYRMMLSQVVRERALQAAKA